MSFYNLPKFKISEVKNRIFKFGNNRILQGVILMLVISSVVGFLAGAISASYFYSEIKQVLQKLEIGPPLIEKERIAEKEYISEISYEKAIIKTVKEVSPSVVSIIISKNLPIYEREWINPFGDLGTGFDIRIPQYVQKGTELREIGAGSGFIVSSDGLVLTNKHVVLDSSAEYTVFTNDGKRYPAKVLALDPVQDLAIMKVEANGEIFQPVILGDSSKIQIGQTVIAIGNALGEFTNTVSVGVVSGLQRTISASSKTGGFSEIIEGTIQTDAAINEGNSGGPLLNLKGEVIGINTAIAEGAQGIGFAIPINMAKRGIEQASQLGKIVYPFLGIRYVSVNSRVQKDYNLPVDYGVFLLKGAGGEPVITPGSAAQKAGLKEGDIILEFNGKKITATNSLATMIVEYKPGDNITLKILRNGEELNIEVMLGERSNQ